MICFVATFCVKLLISDQNFDHNRLAIFKSLTQDFVENEAKYYWNLIIISADVVVTKHNTAYTVEMLQHTHFVNFHRQSLCYLKTYLVWNVPTFYFFHQVCLH